MVAGYVIQIRDVYLAKLPTDREQVRRSMFMDLLELEVPELMHNYEWRSSWFSTDELPLVGGPSETEVLRELPDATDEEIRSVILQRSDPIDQRIIDDIWSTIDEAMQLISR
jgi:hypothetical protein